MQKVRSFTVAIALFITACSFVACKKDVGSGTGGPASENSSSQLTAGNGQTVTIKGTNLLAGGQAPVVMLNNRKLSVVSSSNDSVKVLIPKMIGSGKITVNIGGKSYDGPYCTYQYNVVVTTIAGTGGVGTNDGPGASATFYCPWGITADVNGDLYVADCYNRLIRKISAATNTVSTIPIPVTIGGNNFFSPYNIALDQSKHDLYVTDFNQHLLKIAADGSQSVIYTGVMPTTGIALGPDGYLYMTNNTTGTMLKLTTSGDSVARYTPGFITPRNIIFDHTGNMFVAGYDGSSSAAAIFKVDNTGNGTIVARDKAFGGWEIAVDTIGNFYEADHFNNVVKLIDPSGNVVTLAGSGTAADVDGIGTAASFNGPEGLTIDAQGNLYVTTFNYATNSGNKVRKIVIQ